MQWRIYYGDGSTYSSNDGSPQSASPYDVQAIVQPDKEAGCANVGRLCLRLHDWYYYRTDEELWYGGDLVGILDLLLGREPIIALCQGRMMPTNRFNEIVKIAMSDPDFPQKSARKKLEHP